MAIQWDDGHETVRRKNLWQLRRTPRGGECQVYIVSEAPVGVWTHFYGNKTMPCEGEHCVACADRQNPRKHWYLAVISKKDGEKFLLEMTDRGADAVIHAMQNGQPLRGRHMRTYRINNKPNGPVESMLFDLAPEHIKIPAAPDIKQCLVIIWSLDSRADTCEPGEEYTRVAAHRRKRKTTDGPDSRQTPELPEPLDAGGLRSADDVHKPAEEARDLPPIPAPEPAKPRTSVPTPTNGRGSGAMELLD